MPLVHLDLDKLRSLAEDRGMTIPMLMQLVGVKRLGTKVDADLKLRIWKVLENRALAIKLVEIKLAFPNATVEKVT